jgi:hypothetical protein
MLGRDYLHKSSCEMEAPVDLVARVVGWTSGGAWVEGI